APRVELGLQLSSTKLSQIEEGAFGIGGRFHYNLSPHWALDTEISHFLENPSGNFGETLVLAGVRVGKRFDRWGVFAKARAGAIHFGGSFFDLRLDEKTHPAFDLGGVAEFYPSRLTVVRFDAGDTIIAYRGATFLPGSSPVPVRLGTTNNFSLALGFGLR